VAHGNVQILDNLHVVRGNDHTQVAQRLHFAPLKAGQADCEGTSFPSSMKSLQHVRRVTTSADRQGNVALIDKRYELLGKYIVVTCVVSPGGHERNVVGERKNA